MKERPGFFAWGLRKNGVTLSMYCQCSVFVIVNLYPGDAGLDIMVES
ncbi:MAG: hypothetical protein OJF47_002889 [Nitrospira sp.]|nr:MAG: hypothetical protein OJF47_002889 [Nitrospira sp.]